MYFTFDKADICKKNNKIKEKQLTIGLHCSTVCEETSASDIEAAKLYILYE